MEVTAGRKAVIEMSVEELVAKAIVPVKKEFICPAPTRLNTPPTTTTTTTTSAPPVSKEKKSKRQIKRERNQEKQSTRNLCPMVAKTGRVDSCSYKDKCRLSHDIDAFKAQKPADLEGKCPFDSSEARKRH